MMINASPVAVEHFEAARHATISRARQFVRTNSGGSVGQGAGFLTQDQHRQIKEAFELFDADKSGQIDLNELRAAVTALGYSPAEAEVRPSGVFYECTNKFLVTAV